MIPLKSVTNQTPGWQTMLSRAVKSVDELLDLLKIEPASMKIQTRDSEFPLRVPHSFVNRMTPGDVLDPLLLQVLPVNAELLPADGYVQDPLDEQQDMALPGVLKKYHGRALMTVTGACAVHCRYCFRRHFPYTNANPVMAQLENTLLWLEQQHDIKEVILSGGDPLSLTDEKLAVLCERLANTGHIQTLRIHTRLPIVLPERVDHALLSWIAQLNLHVVMVVHCNHPNEIDKHVVAAMQALKKAGVTLFNQSVMLRDINDNAETLVRLSEKLFSAGVLPYYLHQLDRVQGAAHFEVSDRRAKRIIKEVHASLPGYLVPKLVRELPGQPGKMLLA